MRQPARIVSVLPAIAIAMVVSIIPCAARSAEPQADTGYPQILINRPACGMIETYDDWLNCKAAERRESSGRKSSAGAVEHDPQKWMTGPKKIMLPTSRSLIRC